MNYRYRGFTPDEPTANFLEISITKKVLKMERLRGGIDEPFVYFISYFHPRIGLTGDEDFKTPLYELLENTYSIITNLSIEEINAKAADKSISTKLGIETGEPV